MLGLYHRLQVSIHIIDESVLGSFLLRFISVEIFDSSIFVSPLTSPARILRHVRVEVIADIIEIKLRVIQPREAKYGRTSAQRWRGLNQLNQRRQPLLLIGQRVQRRPLIGRRTHHPRHLVLHPLLLPPGGLVTSPRGCRAPSAAQGPGPGLRSENRNNVFTI